MTAIAKDHVVRFHFTLTNAEGEVLGKSENEPLAYLHGHNNIVAGLEKALEGKSAGDELKVTVAPEEAYGEHQPELVQTVSKDLFQGVENIEAGMEFQSQTEAGINVVVVKAVEGNNVIIDANHPFAGLDLTFDVKVEDVRPADEEEISHGHVHGVGGHHH